MISVKNLFPNKKGINTTKLKLAQNSIYSVTRPSEAEKITKIFNKIFDRKKNLVVIDGTSNVGGDVINFAMNPLVKKVYAIEFNEETFKLLKHNVGVYQLESKVDLIHGNSSKKIFENDVIEPVDMYGTIPERTIINQPSMTIKYASLLCIFLLLFFENSIINQPVTTTTKEEKNISLKTPS